MLNQFIYLSSNFSSNEYDINKHLGKVVTAIDMSSNIRISLINKQDFFQVVAVSILLYGSTTWTPTNRAILNKSWYQHLKKQQQYGDLLPISHTFQVIRTKRGEHCWKIMNEVISDIFIWILIHKLVSIDQRAKICTHQLCVDTRCCLEDLPAAMDDRNRWWGRETTWWW